MAPCVRIACWAPCLPVPALRLVATQWRPSASPWRSTPAGHAHSRGDGCATPGLRSELVRRTGAGAARRSRSRLRDPLELDVETAGGCGACGGQRRPDGLVARGPHFHLDAKVRERELDSSRVVCCMSKLTPTDRCHEDCAQVSAGDQGGLQLQLFPILTAFVVAIDAETRLPVPSASYQFTTKDDAGRLYKPSSELAMREAREGFVRLPARSRPCIPLAWPGSHIGLGHAPPSGTSHQGQTTPAHHEADLRGELDPARRERAPTRLPPLCMLRSSPRQALRRFCSSHQGLGLPPPSLPPKRSAPLPAGALCRVGRARGIGHARRTG